MGLIHGDARRLPLGDGSVQCVVTSPPYLGLRKYAGEQELVWLSVDGLNGSSVCEHEWGDLNPGNNRGGSGTPTNKNNRGENYGRAEARGQDCLRCGAWRGAYGLEPIADCLAWAKLETGNSKLDPLCNRCYVCHTVLIMREIRRVLRDDGVVFWNLGDSYASGEVGRHDAHEKKGFGASNKFLGTQREYHRPLKIMKPKDLCLIPQRVALGAQRDGWWVRSDIIWAKPNPMPESCKDRPTDAYEHVLLLAKGQWKPRVIQFADFRGQRFHLGKNLWLEESASRIPGAEFCVRIASALFYGCQRENKFGLPPLDSEIWQKGTNARDGGFVCNNPKEHRAAVLSALFLNSAMTAEEFLCQLNSLWVALADADDGRVLGIAAQFLAPTILCNADGAVAVNDAGEIGKFDFAHRKLIIPRATPIGCSYYWDADAVAEASATSDIRRPYTSQGAWELDGRPVEQRHGGKPRGGATDFRGQGHFHGGANAPANRDGREMKEVGAGITRNLRNVWFFATQPYKGAHFATFPEELPRRCILAATSSKGACAQCGRPWERVVGKTATNPQSHKGSRFDIGKTGVNGEGRVQEGERFGSQTTGWRPTCECRGQHGRTVPCVVLDPFAGSGTTGRVALELGRRFVGIDLAYGEDKHSYAPLARERSSNVQPVLV